MDFALLPNIINANPAKPIAQSISNGFFKVDTKWTITYWNKAAEQILGKKAEDIIGKNLWAEFAELLPLEFYTVYYKAFQQENPVHFREYWGELGSWFDVITYYCDNTLSVSFKAIRPKNENPAEQLQSLNELYRYITEVTNDCLWDWDLNSKEIFWIDGGHKRVFGYEIENALIPQDFWESRIHPDDRERILLSLNRFIEMGTAQVWEEEYRFQKQNNEYADVHDRGRIVYDDKDKNVRRMIGVTEDITLRKETELKLLESESKLAMIARQTNNGLMLSDSNNKITWVNNAFTRLTEYKSQDVIGRQLGSFLQGKETLPETLTYLREKIRVKEPFTCDVLNYSKSGKKIWTHVEGQQLLNDKGENKEYFVIQTDISERILLENKMKQEKNDHQKSITDAVLTAQENERANIGRELNDNINQILGAAKLYIELAKTDQVNREVCLNKSSGYIMDVISEIRMICKAWASPEHHITGLFKSTRILIEDLKTVHPLQINLLHEGFDDNQLDEKLQLNIYRIIQEQLNNIIKHSKASIVKIEIGNEGAMIKLIIADNGLGCETGKLSKGTGLMNILSRAEMYDGSVIINTAPGNGYELKVMLKA
ncbi:MAG: sensor histidine kinase [Flavisolibacter sp.]